MKEEQKNNQLNNMNDKKTDIQFKQENSKGKDTIIQMPEFPKFEKIYENKDLNMFKEDILNHLKERDIITFNLIRMYQDKIETTEKNYLELAKRISNNYSDILSSQAKINNRLDKLNSYESFSTKTNDQLISHEIRINNLREEYNKSVQKYDKIYLDNLELPGYIGKYSKYKNCQVFFDEVIKEINKFNSYKEKNTLDLKAYKDKLELIIKTFNTLVDNNNKSHIKYINEMNEKNNKDCKNMIDALGDRMTEMRIENSRYAVELIGKSINLTKEWDKIQGIKEEIMKEFNSKIHDFRIVSNNTVNSFHDFKAEFTLIKRKFFELAEFIRDVRFRKNIGGDVKKKEIKVIAKKITGKKPCGESIDKEKGKELLELNFKNEKIDKNEKNEKNDLRQSVSQEPGSKIKSYIKGVTNAEELNKDSKIHDLSSGKIKRRSKMELRKNPKSINTKDEYIIRRKQKIPTVIVYGPSNLKKLDTSKKENTGMNSEESEISENNNSISNLIYSSHTNNKNINISAEGIGSKNTNLDSNTNNRYLFKDVPIETDDKIINELASELEQTNNKKDDSKNKGEKDNIIQNLINKIEPMNINMNINKIENLNVNNNHNNSHRIEEIKPALLEEKKDNNYLSNENNINPSTNSLDKKMNNFDQKITNLEVYTKEKIIDLIGQIENLRQLFLNTNKLPSFTTSPLFNFTSSCNNTNTNNANQPSRGKEAHIVEIGAKLLPPPSKVSKKYISNSNNAINIKEKDKESSKDTNSVFSNKNDINLARDINHRIKTGKNPTSIKTIINKTLGGNNNTIIFSNMANDFNSKFLKGVEKRTIIDGGIIAKNLGDNKMSTMNKFIDLNKITTNLATKTQNNFKNEVNLLAGDNNNLP